jgi:aryl carrier-like protein
MLILIQVQIRHTVLTTQSFKNTYNVNFRMLARRATMTTYEATVSGDGDVNNVFGNCYELN